MSLPNVATRLVGRDEDIAAVRAFVDQAAAHGGALVISGDAGVGKSALIEAAGSYAVSAGLRLLRATGAQFEANVSFAGLHQLLFPLLGSHLDQLDGVQRTALRSALGLQEGAAPDRMTISHAALELLTRAAGTTPILIVVDDLPWLDQASGLVLGFVARRAVGTNVGFLATARTGEDGFFDRSGIRAYELQPLSDAWSEILLDSQYPALSLRARRRLLEEAQGNPLALLELPIALTSQHADRAVTGTLPLTRRLQTVFAGSLARVQLAYGERLRRTQAPSEARTHLSAAADAFEHLGARPWAARAANELRATGIHRERPDSPDNVGLTAQQRQIAELAAAGLSNKQIAERLFLSPRTVGYHLHQIFPKLGVTSRAALRAALAELPDTEGADHAPPG